MRVLLILQSRMNLVRGLIIVDRTKPIVERIVVILKEDKAKEVFNSLEKKGLPESIFSSIGRTDRRIITLVKGNLN